MLTIEKKNNLINILIVQKEIFGSDLFIPNNELIIKKKINNIIYHIEETVNSNETKTQPQLFSVDNERFLEAEDLKSLFYLTKDCTKCDLSKYRTTYVFGSGNPNAEVMVIGEGPGAEEDKQGLPFVGRAGMLLTDILKAIKFQREEVYIANIVKCRPPNNRTPSQQEINRCFPYLEKQIDLIKPKLILCLGLTAAKGLLGIEDSLSTLRGKVFHYKDSIKVMVTFHPAALLRNPNWKKDCWKDVQEFRKLYEETIIK